MAAAGHTEGADELFKVDRAVLVFVEYVEDIVGKVIGLAKGEELLVDFAELGLVELAGGAVLAEALVPLLELLLVEVCVLDEIAELFGPPGPVSDTSAAPLGAKATANAPAPALAFPVICDNVPSGRTPKTSM